MRYEYFLLGDSVPIRVAFNHNDHRIGAEVPSRTDRRLSMEATYLSRLDHSFEVEKIDREQFEKHCERVWNKRGL